jgi:hypothetical protein
MPSKSFRRTRSFALISAAMFLFYIATAGLVSALYRHASEGRLQWLRWVPGALDAMTVYVWLARQMGSIPVAGRLFDLSAEFWCAVTDAPDTT